MKTYLISFTNFFLFLSISHYLKAKMQNTESFLCASSSSMYIEENIILLI